MDQKEMDTLKISFRRLTKGGKRNLKFPILRILLDKKDVSSESELYKLDDKELLLPKRRDFRNVADYLPCDHFGGIGERT